MDYILGNKHPRHLLKSTLNYNRDHKIELKPTLPSTVKLIQSFIKILTDNDILFRHYPDVRLIGICNGGWFVIRYTHDGDVILPWASEKKHLGLTIKTEHTLIVYPVSGRDIVDKIKRHNIVDHPFFKS